MSSHDVFRVQLAGIIEANDGECHMTNNEYTFSDKQVRSPTTPWCRVADRRPFLGLPIDWTNQREAK